ncbi:MAG: ABC-2 family transporter protein [Cyanobacteria bacterium]|nr:ABC-2 family transporter protein [Cyanobacteriota bacterium]
MISTNRRNPFGKYFKIAATAARSNCAYLSEVVSRSIFLGVVLYIFLRLWQVTFSESGHDRLGGLTLSEMIWYLTMSEAIVLSDSRMSQQVDEDVRGGTLSVKLIRPIAYPLYTLSSFLGERIVRFLLNLIVGGAVAFIFVGPLSINWMTPLLVIPAVFLAFVLDGLFQLIIGLAAFWLEDTSGIFLIYSRLRMLLGGMLIPVQLLPQWLVPTVNALPFTSVIYAPAYLFVTGGCEDFAGLFLRQLVWIAVAAVSVRFVYDRALKIVAVNGG